MGLVTKVRVLEVPVHSASGWLAVLAAVASVIGLAYYLRFAAILFAAPEGSAVAVAGPTAQRAPGGTRWAVGLTLAVSVVLSAAPALVLGLLGP